MSNEMNKNVVAHRPDRDVEIEPDNKKCKTSIISDHVESAEFEEIFAKHWHSLKPVKTDKIEIITEPYRICKISNFLEDDDFITSIKDELQDVESHRKDMDLYQFTQTSDLANVNSKYLASLYKTFKSSVAKWMERNTSVSLNGKISMSSATYADTDYLLCHDDNMGDRKIAFILYLSKNWTPQDGGALDIFNTDENGQPKDVVQSLIPQYNSLVFFEVLDNSYHQVAEVTSSEKLRISINGWFHGQLRESNKQRRPEFIYKYFEPEYTQVDLVSHVSKIYLYDSIVKNIQKTIEKDSFIYLPGFILPEIHEKLRSEVKNKDIKWQKIGPADFQNYEIACEDTLPNVLKEVYNMFKSIHIFHLLKQYTELDLVPETDDTKPRMKIELQRWSRGCYMLINNQEVSESMKLMGTCSETGDNCNDVEDLKVEETGPCKEISKIKSNISKNVSTCSEDINHVQIKTDETISEKSERKPVIGSKILKNSQSDSQASVEKKLVKKKRKSRMSKAASSSNCSNLSNEEFAGVVSGESESSDIEDYLSDPESNCGSEIMSESDGEGNDVKQGTLDVLLQFHTESVPEDATIDYVDPSQIDGALIHIPPQDNHLCLVYRTSDICRCNKYVNHYCKDYFYTLVCSYYE